MAASFSLSEGCKLVIQGGDLTKWKINGETDAIVNAANEGMLGGGGVDGAIHDAAGDELYQACLQLPARAPGARCPTGDAVMTPGFNLPVPKIIHTVGPVYDSRKSKEAAQALEQAYRTSLTLARSEGVKYIAFPAISCGIFGYPLAEAADIALRVCKEECHGFDEIHFVLFTSEVWNAWARAADRAKLPKIDQRVQADAVHFKCCIPRGKRH